jgi:hypothetical protein
LLVNWIADPFSLVRHVFVLAQDENIDLGSKERNE